MNNKTINQEAHLLYALFQKIPIAMRLSLLFMFLLVFQMHAENIHSQDTKISLSMRNSTVEKVLQSIEEKSEYYFLYNNKLINVDRKVDVKVKNAAISEILNKLFDSEGVEYEVEGSQIILSPKEMYSQTTSVTGDSQQQKKTITGVVVDQFGTPIIGANIIEIGTTNGTITDIDGEFRLSVENNANINITYIGYIGQDISTQGRSSFKITLVEDTEMLDEVIVVAYGTSSARKTASAVSSIKTDKIDELPYTTTSASLQGRVAGVIVQQSGGEPGSSTPILSIRGGGTPLFIIDGIIRSSEEFNSLTASDIESMSILKDASATAVYGAQAGNGILLVTTKKGSNGLNIDYTGGLDMSKPTTLADRVGALDYVLASNAAARYDGQGEYALYPKNEVDAIAKGTSQNYGNQDWYEEATRNFAPQSRHNVTIHGRTDNGISHFTSLGVYDQKSIFKQSHNNHYQRYNVRSNISTTFDEYGLEVGFNLDGNYSKRTPNPYGQENIWRNLLGYNKAIDKIYNDDGTYTALDVHPIVYLDSRSGYINQYNNNVNAQGYIDWKLPWVKGLSAKLTGNSNYLSYDNKSFSSRAPQYSNGELVGGDRPKELGMNRSWTRGNTVEFGVNYALELGLHFLEAQGVYSYYDEYNEWFNASRIGFISNDFDQLSSGDASTKDNSGGAAERTRIGYVGRLRYTFANKYFLESNFRYDGSDNFAENKRWGLFPSAAAAWALSEENFMKPLIDNDIIDFAKIRASYGVVGLEDGVARFGYIPVYNYSAQSTVIGGRFVPGFSEGNLVSPDILSWYTKNIFDVGADLAFLENALTVSLDYYYYRTKGYLISPQNRYSTTLGKSLPQVKSNSVHRRAGYEASAKYKNSYKGLKYELGFQFTTYNELWEVKEDEALTDLMDPRKRMTHRKNVYGSSYYYNDGLYTDNESILDSPRRLSSAELKQGDLKYKDINGDGKIDSDDQIKIGKPFFPLFDYGFDFNLEYNGFFLNGLFQGTGDRYTELALLYKGGNIVSSNYNFQLDFWTPDNQDAKFPRSSALQSTNSGNNTVNSDFWLINAKYFRLKSLQLGYDFKKILFKNYSGISRFKVSLLGTNIFTISDTMDYFDPEAYNYGEGYPVQKTYSIVLNIGI
jgi:TonB-linked SusC/RagA family outer membrane protein